MSEIAPAPSSLASWLRDDAWPFWLGHGVDRARGGFHEEIDPSTLACEAGFRRLRVVARQVYVFSQAARYGLAGGGEAVEIGLRFLDRHAALGDGSYARRFTLDGMPTDTSRDLYDHAFTLLALASAATLLPPALLRERARALLGFLDREMRHPAGGYLESLPPALPRRQNPHMHLLEACLASAEAFGDEVFLDRAGEMVALFRDRLFHPGTGTLPEYFSEDWAVEAGGPRHAVEPGHHCEWVWLLAWQSRLARGAPAPEAGALMRFVDRHAINPRLGTLRDELWSDGAVKAAGSRLWPQTERLKAEHLRPDPAPARITASEAALRQHLRGAPRGLWHERLREDGTPVPGPVPASSLYHLTCAILTVGGDRAIGAA